MYQDIDAYDINVCNQALMRIGGKRISAFDDTTVEARDCAAMYETLRDLVLESFPWTFAKNRATLKMATDTPDFGYSYYFTLPSDCLRPLKIDTQDLMEEPEWVVEGDFLLTDEEEVNLHYIKRVYDAQKYSPSFVNALSLLIASRLAMSVAKNQKMYRELNDEYIRYLEQDAMVVNAGIGNEKPYKPSTYADAR